MIALTTSPDRSPITDAVDLAEPVPWLRWALTLGIVYFGVLPLLAGYLVLAERKVAARFQDRIGPNRVGPLGLLQPIADALKLLIKEPASPESTGRILYTIAPVIMVVAPFVILALIPLAPGLQIVDAPAGLLLVFAAGGIPTLGIFLAGWASRSKFALLGGMRGMAQLVSYEIPQVLAALPPVLWAGSLGMASIVESQTQSGWGWYLFSPPGLVGAFIFFVAGLAEVNRAPFDLPEAESELVAGYHTEYAGIRFGLFFLAEYLGMVAIAALVTTLYLGAGTLPGPLEALRIGWIDTQTLAGQLVDASTAALIFATKCGALIFVMFWIRATLPRLRIDRLMHLAWKRLVPLSLVNLLAAALWFEVVLREPANLISTAIGWAVTGSILGVGLVAIVRIDWSRPQPARDLRVQTVVEQPVVNRNGSTGVVAEENVSDSPIATAHANGVSSGPDAFETIGPVNTNGTTIETLDAHPTRRVLVEAHSEVPS